MTSTEIASADKIMLGSTEVAAMYIGDTLVWANLNTPIIVQPYDAEIEYLESAGTPYIDTGIVNDSSVIVEMKMSATGKDRLNGAEPNTNNRYKWGSDGNGRVYYGFASNHAASVTFTLDSPCTFYLKQGQQYVKDNDGNTILSSSDSLSSYSSAPIKLFRCTSGSGLVSLNGSGSIRIYSCNITNSTTLLQLIPVRIGSVGYLYDKVSGQLFGNVGDGSFVLGPDKQ